MNIEQTRALLSEVATIDNRKLSKELAESWHIVLQRFELEQCRQALHTFWRNRPDDFMKPGHLVEIMDRLGDQAEACEHGIVITPATPCHDCANPTGTQATNATWPGTGMRQAAIIASLDLGKGRWTAHADIEEVLRLKAVFRTERGVVYPGEAHCLDGHEQHQRPRVTAAGRICGHPEHHPVAPAEADEEDELEW